MAKKVNSKGKVCTSIFLLPELQKELRIRTVQYGTTMTDVVEEGIRTWLMRHPEPNQQVKVKVDAVQLGADATDTFRASSPAVTIVEDAIPDCNRICMDCKYTACLHPDYLQGYLEKQRKSTASVDTTSDSENTKVIV